MRVVWTRAALQGLEAIADYVAQHDHIAALRLVMTIPERTNTLLADNPAGGRAGRVAGTRELALPGTPYIVAYRVGDRVDVLAVMHGARMAGTLRGVVVRPRCEPSRPPATAAFG